MKRFSEIILGDMLLVYDTDEQDCVSMSLIPAHMKGRILQKEYRPEPLVQIHARGDQLPNGYGNGHTTATAPASAALNASSYAFSGSASTPSPLIRHAAR